MFAALEAANREKCSSAALPAISSGVFGFPIEVSSRIIIDAIIDFCKEPMLRSIRDIHFVEHNQDNVVVFLGELEKKLPSKTGERAQNSHEQKFKSAIGTSGENL